MTPLRHSVLAALLGTSLVACSSAEPLTGAPPDAQLTDAQRSALANRLVDASAGTGEGSIAAAFAAAALVGGAKIRSVDVGTAAAGSGYYAVALQVTQAGSPDSMSVIVAWRQDADAVPTDFALTLGAGSGENTFAPQGDKAPTAFAMLYKAPSAFWVATDGTTSLRRTTSGTACRDVSQRLAYAGYTGTCQCATFAGAIDVTASVAPSDPSNTAQGSAIFALQETTVDGVVITVTGPATTANVVSAR